MSHIRSSGKRDIKGKTVLITGASAGIGEATAYFFAEEGCNLVLVARREERLLEVSAECTRRNADVTVAVVPADVTDRASLESLPDKIPAELLPVEILINNAGLAKGYNRGWETPMEHVDLMLDTNVKALVQITNLFLPGMIERNSGHIINVGSIAGDGTYPMGALYCASKHAVHSYTECLRKELMETDVNVSIIAPGLVSTEFFKVRLDGDEERAAKVVEGNVALDPADIADCILFAATRRSFVNVQKITVTSTHQAGVAHVHRTPVSEGASSSK